MQKITEFLKNCQTFYLATEDAGKPQVRPFGAVCEFEDKIYLITSNNKAVYRQMIANPNIAISGMHDGKWLRLSGQVQLDDRRQARQAMLDENPMLKDMYSADDSAMAVLYLAKAKATVCSYTADPKDISLS